MLLLPRTVGIEKTKLVHEECLLAHLIRFSICNDLVNDLLSLVRCGVSQHLLEAFLDESCQIDQVLVATTLNLVVLKQDVCAEKTDCLVNDVVSRCVWVVFILRGEGMQSHAARLLSLLPIEL